MKHLRLACFLVAGLLCLNLSAAYSYQIKAEEAGSDSFKILHDSLRYGSLDRTGIWLNVTRNSGVISNWLNLDGSQLVNAGVTFQEGDLISFSRSVFPHIFPVDYSIKVMNEHSFGFNADYNVDYYFQLPGIGSGNLIDMHLTNSNSGDGFNGGSGNPLPGLLATLLIGGGSALVLKKRKSKRLA